MNYYEYYSNPDRKSSSFLDNLPFILIIFLIIIVFLVVVMGYISEEITYAEKDKECHNLGYKEFDLWNGEQACVDYNGDIVFVKMDCYGILDVRCNAREIKVGEVYGKLK